MPVSDSDRQIVADLCTAMQEGPSGSEALLGLFAEDGVLVEPFSGRMRTHVGKPAIRASLAEMMRDRAPDFTLTLGRVDMDGDRVRAEWTCTASVLPGPMRGYDLFTIRAGKIARLEIFITEMPPMGR
jgi:ketosteroid isomerase-like protein